MAYGTLTTLGSDDSRRVSEAATKSLETYIEAWHQRTRAANEQADGAPQPDLSTAAIDSPVPVAPATQPARKPVPRARVDRRAGDRSADHRGGDLRTVPISQPAPAVQVAVTYR